MPSTTTHRDNSWKTRQLPIREALREAASLLAPISDEASFEAELLLSFVLSIDRTRLYKGLSERLTSNQRSKYRALLNRRLAREPAAYILGHKEFFGLDFKVGPAVLIPRPETESLVEAVIRFANERFREVPLRVADVGTGSGAIAIGLAHKLPNADIAAIDASVEALELARRNAERHGLDQRIRIVQSDLLEMHSSFDIIVANLPYVATSEWERLPAEIHDYEPRQALDGGPDGLHVIGRLLKQAPQHLAVGGALFVEIGDEQGPTAIKLAGSSFPSSDTAIATDLAGRDRVLVIRT